MRLEVREASQIAAARRVGSDLAHRLGLDETLSGRVALLIMEAATNIVKHATHGEILLRPVKTGDVAGVEILAIDAGPGMSNLGLSMQDGTSTAGSYGVGLGTMHRVADEFDIYSGPGGTVVAMTVWASKQAGLAAPWQVGAVFLPLPGEDVSGDAWAVYAGVNCLSIVVADGLGHGPEAALAAEAATGQIARCHELPPAVFMQEAHAGLRGTRGAAVAVTRLDCLDEKATFAGIGNIAGCIVDGSKRHQLISHNGIVGSSVRKVQEFVAPWTDGSTIIQHSDGLTTRWDLEQYPGLASRHPSLIAAVLYRDFSRNRDDLTVLALRQNRDS